MACVVRLLGGLGNQLFQYAFGRAVSAQYRTELLLDTTLLRQKDSSITPRDYALAPFRVAASVVSTGDPRLPRLPANAVGRWLSSHGLIPGQQRLILERSFRFDPSVLEKGGHGIFQGYWQSERYFAHIKRLLLTDLDFPKSQAYLSLAAEMADQESVSVHVRRGDYVSNPSASATHGTCSASYYRKVFEYVESQVRNPRYFVFTDDIKWVDENRELFPSDTVIVSNRYQFPTHEELFLMSCCRHSVVANSSFSWWGAWLKNQSQGLTVAPKAWFQKDIDATDLVPERWHRI